VEYPWLSSANKIFRIVVLIQWLVCLFIAFLTDNWLAPFVIGLPILALPLILSFTHASAPISRYAFGISVQLFAALHIQQAYGMTELHFEIFVVLAFLSYFRDWKVIAISTTVVAVHHILFFIVQSNGGPLLIFEQNKLTFYILVIHAVFAIAEGILLGVMAKISLNEARSSIILNNAVSNIMRHKDVLDLTVDIPEKSKNIKDFKQLIHAFKKLITESTLLSQNVSRVANKVSQSTSTLETSFAESVGQVNLITTSVEEISQSINEIATRSNQSNVFAEEAKNSTLETKSTISSSSKNVSQLRETLVVASETIQALSVKCNNISEVMQSIKSVAEQTNLLALNAAIESARAGEHGRGFAVVADEVRNLAIKSKESAEEIEHITVELIASADRSVSEMNGCVTLVDEAVKSSSSSMKSMDSVVEGFQNVSDNIMIVASSTEQQSKNVNSIAESARLLREFSVTEQTDIGYMSNDSQELNKLCARLEAQLKVFAV
jgi:methyl-accepting chemotaxis protein